MTHLPDTFQGSAADDSGRNENDKGRQKKMKKRAAEDDAAAEAEAGNRYSRLPVQAFD